MSEKDDYDFEKIGSDPSLEELRLIKSKKAFPGCHNQEDINRGFKTLNFLKQALPMGEELIAKDPQQLFTVCRESGINHLIYSGFAINWCLLGSPGGMLDMYRRGIMCSAIRQAVTAVENKETAAEELCKEIGLWRVALQFGFVFDDHDIISALSGRIL